MDGCTGFQWAEWIFPAIRACCDVHDIGGTDGTLLAWPLAAIGVAVMVLFRPVYNWIKGKGTQS
jgi:hypothetical protein